MRIFRSFFVAALVLSCWTAAARAEWTEARPDDVSRFSLKSIEFEGDPPLSEGELRNVIRSSTSGILRFRPVDLERIEGDVVRLRNYFRRQGYWNVKVDRRIFFDPETRHTRVVFEIDAGQPRYVGKITVEGERTFPESEILSWTKLRTGDRFDLSLTSNDRGAIEDEYANRGFYQVRVIADIQAPEGDAPEPEPEEDDRIVHDLVFRIDEGLRFLVGRVTIEGNRFTDARTILRELALESGQVLNREQLSESRARLYSTGYFSRVQLLPQTAAANEGTVDVLVRVVERKMRFVGLGVGYGTQDQLRLSGEWGHRNLWGRGKRATVRGVVATELFPADLVRTRVEGRYVEPWLFGTRTTGTGEVFFEETREFTPIERPTGTTVEEYDLRLVGLVLNANRRLTRNTRGWVSLENEWADADFAFEPTEDLRLEPDITRTFSLTLERDRRDDFFEPRGGFLHRIIASVSGGVLGGDNDFWRLVGEANWYRTTRAIVWAGRLRIGYERPFGDSEVVQDRDRFKLGGANTVRGYSERENDLSIGPGDFVALANVEARFPLFWLLQAGVFMDGGNAWDDISDVRFVDFRPGSAKDDPDEAASTDFRYSVGSGLRVTTPVGPIRLDVARKLKLVRPGEDTWNLHLSLGHAF